VDRLNAGHPVMDRNTERAVALAGPILSNTACSMKILPADALSRPLKGRFC